MKNWKPFYCFCSRGKACRCTVWRLCDVRNSGWTDGHTK